MGGGDGIGKYMLLYIYVRENEVKEMHLVLEAGGDEYFNGQ